MVAGFEQRSCFPLDSIRNEDGQYPADTYEVVYPGVHSDVGGGYPENDQGKAARAPMNWCRRSFCTTCMPPPLPLARRCRCLKRCCRKRCLLRSYGAL
nr:DUF2235 domain-containing protein [Pseudomonas syringae]